MNQHERNSLDNYITGHYGEDQFAGEAGWEKLHDGIDADGSKNKMSDMDVFVAWKMGLAAFLEAKKLGTKFLHE